MIWKTNKEEEQEFKRSQRYSGYLVLFIMGAMLIMLCVNQYLPGDMPEGYTIEKMYHSNQTIDIILMCFLVLLLVMLAMMSAELKYTRRRLDATIRILDDVDEFFGECFNDPYYWRDHDDEPAESDVYVPCPDKDPEDPSVK